MNLAIIGYGYWGPNLVRNFSQIKECNVHTVADLSDVRLSLVKQNYPYINTSSDISNVLSNVDIDAVVIATPVFTHFELAKKALLNGKHVMIEKPMTSSEYEAKELIDLSIKVGKIIMVDHTFLYTGALAKMKEIIDSNQIGKLKYFDSTRINLGLFQPDINVLWDLAPHDLSILNYLVAYKPYSVNATGISHTNNGIENVAYMTVNYNTDFIAHFNCSWTSPVKVRSTLIGGDKKMILYNDLEPSEKVRVYDTGFEHKTEEDRTKIMVDYRVGDVHIPHLSSIEALYGVAQDFVFSILQNKSPLANAELGLNVVKILEAAQKSIKNNGKEIII
jgi:predicted dehydrogenase